MSSEIARLIRHIIAPLVIILVDQGWLPEAAQNDVTEGAIIIVTFVVAFVWSWRNERKALAQEPPQ